MSLAESFAEARGAREAELIQAGSARIAADIGGSLGQNGSQENTNMV
jgi:hypothetical protein